MSPLGSRISVGIPAASASSSSTMPSPVLPEPVMPTITPWVVRSAGSSSSGVPVGRRAEAASDGELHGAGGGVGALESHDDLAPRVGRAGDLRAHGGIAQLDDAVVDDDARRSVSPSRPGAGRPRRGRRPRGPRRPRGASRAAIVAGQARATRRGPAGRGSSRTRSGPAAAAAAPSRARTARRRPSGSTTSGQRAVEGRVARAGADPRRLVHDRGVRRDRRVEQAHELRVGDVGRPVHAQRRGGRAGAARRPSRRRRPAACAGCRRCAASIRAAAAIPRQQRDLRVELLVLVRARGRTTVQPPSCETTSCSGAASRTPPRARSTASRSSPTSRSSGATVAGTSS